MTEPCRHCRSERTVRNGVGPIAKARYLDRGTIAERKGSSARLLCRECGKASSVRDPQTVAADIDVRDHVVDLVFAHGQAGAARECGLARTTVQEYCEMWADAREPEVNDAAPGFLLLDVGLIRGVECLLVVDFDRESLVEVLTGPAALACWLSRDAREPAAFACVPMDVRIASVVRKALPHATLMLAPTIVLCALQVDALMRLRALRRSPDMFGCNAMPRDDEFMAADESRAPCTDGWPSRALSLLAAVRCATAVLSSPDRPAAERLWPELMVVSAVAGAGRITDMFSFWREDILNGIDHLNAMDHAFVDGRIRLVEQVRLAMIQRRPALGVSDMRGLVLLRNFRRDLELRPGSSMSRAVSVGSLLSASLKTLTEQPAAG